MDTHAFPIPIPTPTSLSTLWVGFLISPCYSLELCIQMGISFLFSFAFSFSSQLFVRPPQTFLHFFFLGIVLITASCTMS